MINESTSELLKRMQGLLRITTCPPYYQSIYHFKAEVQEKIKFIKQKEICKS
jgi:hypothetical protein